MKHYDMREKILGISETFIQTNGYNAFSYRDIAKLIGIKTSSIHYYFPTKRDLGKAVVKNHIDLLCADLEQLKTDKRLSCREKLKLFFESIFAKTYLSKKKMCLGGMLASDVLTLDESMRIEVRKFFDQIEHWLKYLLTAAVEKKEFNVEKNNIKSEARHILSVLEGALLMARLYDEESRLVEAQRFVMEHLNRK
jgi:TetR/AcrR family transcriptional repressor of nem operon